MRAVLSRVRKRWRLFRDRFFGSDPASVARYRRDVATAVDRLIDYDAIFCILARAHFSGWISVEDGMNGLGELTRSVTFLQEKRCEYYG